MSAKERHGYTADVQNYHIKGTKPNCKGYSYIVVIKKDSALQSYIIVINIYQ
jgi:hypothetical protein